MRADPAAVIDAILDDLDDAGLIPSGVRRFTVLDDRGLTVDDCPALVLALDTGSFSAATTGAYGQRTLSLELSYHVSVALGVESGGVGDEEAAREAVSVLEAMINHLETRMGGLGQTPDPAGYVDLGDADYERGQSGVFTASIDLSWTEL